MLEIVIGNLSSLLGMALDSYSSTKKTKKEMLFIQNISLFVYGTGSIFLKGYSASVQNYVGIIRNVVAAKEYNSEVLKWFLILLGVALGLVFNNRGLIGLLPIIANLEYSIAVFTIKDNEKLLKICFLLNVLCFTIFCVFIYNFVGVITNSIVIISCMINILKK
jgi:4-amino-4-deoxy-L-arabinose transferase-like glycosyltransferase